MCTYELGVPLLGFQHGCRGGGQNVCVSVFSILALVNNLYLFLFNVSRVKRTLRHHTNKTLHAVLNGLAKGGTLNFLANLTIATIVRDSSTAAIVIINFIGSNLVALARTVDIVVNTGINAAVAT